MADQSSGLPPPVFISYSWDSEEHKAWAKDLATGLREDGVDVVIDAWGLRLGGRSPEFMESGIRKSKRVLIICTPEYKNRSERREGGAGYEGHIITGEILAGE